MSDTPTPITPTDPKKRLAELEMDIGTELEAARATGIGAFFDAGNALRTIRDEELYRIRKHRTFGAYYRKRWRLSDDEVSDIIECSDESLEITKFVRQLQDEPRLRAIEREPDDAISKLLTGPAPDFSGKFDPKNMPTWATFADFQHWVNIYVAAAGIAEAKLTFIRALKALHDDHREYRTPGELVSAFGINPHDFDDCL